MVRLSNLYVLSALMTVVIGLLGLLGAGVLACLAVIVWLTWAFRPHLPLTAAIVVAALLPTVGMALISTWSYLVAIPFPNIQLGYFIALVWLSAALKGGKQASTQSMTTAERWSYVAAFVPSALVFVMLLIGGNLFGHNLGWMLTGDAQNNTVAVRELVSHNGADPQFNSAPALTQLLMASAVASTVPHAGSASSFIGMVQAQAILLALLWCAASAVFGLIAVREFSHRSVGVRSSAAFLGAVIPFTWFVLGFSITAGFYNTPATLLALGFAWVIWRDQEELGQRERWKAVALMLLTTLFTAMAWVPLALIPGVLLVGIVSRSIWIDRTPRDLLHWPVFSAFGALVLYVALVIAPSFFAHGESLAAAGWMAELPKITVLMALLLAVIVAGVFGAVGENGGGTRTGILLYLVGMSAGLGFLMASNVRSGEIWSYYPRKFAWMAVFVLMILTALIALSSESLKAIRPIAWRFGVVFGVLAVFAVGLKSTPFMQSGPLKVVPLVDVAVNGTASDAAVMPVSEVVGTRSIRLDYDDNDFLVNQWAFQWASAHDGSDSIWSFAYSLIKSPADVCSAAQTWGGDITFVTRSQQTANQVEELCGPLIAKIEGVS